MVGECQVAREIEVYNLDAAMVSQAPSKRKKVKSFL
jgi:hypothetical protein